MRTAIKHWHIPTLALASLTGAIALNIGNPLSTVGQSTDLQTFRQQALAKHNTLRQKHGAQPLTLDANLNNVAQDWAQQLAKTGQMKHRPNGKYGENIFYVWSSQPGYDVNGATPVQSWYDEVSKYNYNKPGFSIATGHFTQVVWKNSKKVGCGKARSADNKVFVVCNYDPPGNFLNQFSQNVSPAK